MEMEDRLDEDLKVRAQKIREVEEKMKKDDEKVMREKTMRLDDETLFGIPADFHDFVDQYVDLKKAEAEKQLQKAWEKVGR